MGRITKPFTFEALQHIVASAKERNVELKNLRLTEQHYAELRKDVQETAGLELPETVNDQYPLLFSGLIIEVWRPVINAKRPSEPAARSADPGG